MRGLAALSVLVYHVSFRFTLPTGAFEQYVTQRGAGPPITAVVLFFLISGFVLYRPFVLARFERRPPPAVGPYAIRRFARIAPGYWVILAIVSAWFGYSYMLHPGGFIRYFGFLQLYGSVHSSGGGIGLAWTLCVEVTFYVVLPLLALGARRLGRRGSLLSSELTLCGLMVLVSLAWQLAITSEVSGVRSLSFLSMLPGSLDLFAAGMALAVLSVEHELRPVPRRSVALVNRYPWPAWALGLAVLYAEGHLGAGLGETGWWLSSHALKLIGCALLLAPLALGAQDRGWLRRLLGSPVFVWLGTVSYGIYLWHYPVLQKLDLHSHSEAYALVLLTAITVVLAGLTYYLVELPSQRLARRWLENRARRRRQPALAALMSTPAAAPPDPQT